MRRTWSAVLLSLTLAACESPTAWSDDLVIEFQVAQTTEDSAAVEGAAGGAVVRGVYRAPAFGYTLRAYYQVSGDEVTVNLGGYPPTSGGTDPGVTGMGYRLSIPLEAGTYTVHVIHHDQGTGTASPRVVTTAQVTAARN